MGNKEIAVSEKYALSINEAAQYFSIGIKKMRRLAEDNLGDFAVYNVFGDGSLRRGTVLRRGEPRPHRRGDPSRDPRTSQSEE